MTMVYAVPTTGQKLRDAEKFVGLTVSHAPQDVAKELPVERIKATPPNNWSSQLGFYTSLLIAQSYVERYGTDPLAGSDFVLRTGVRDAADTIGKKLEKVPHALSLDQALTIARDPRTIDTIALEAMRPSEGENGLRAIWETRSELIHLTDDYSAIIADPDLLPQPGGCPAAGDAETLTVNPTPLFRHFAQWSGELALRALHYHS